MADIFLGLLSANESVNYQIVVIGFMAYMLLLWIVVTIWVYKDAKSRFEGKFMPVLMALLNLLLFFPFLIIYLLVRPHYRDEFDDWHEGGVNIPIVNFTGNDGVVMSFELRVNPKRIAENNDNEMKIDISFDSKDENKRLVEPKAVEVSVPESKKFVVREYLSGILTKLKDKRTQFVGEQTKVVETTTPVTSVLETVIAADTDTVKSEEPRHKKKKKKRR